MCGSDKLVSSSSLRKKKKQNTTVEWECCNLITALHWGEAHGGGAVSCGSVLGEPSERTE